MCAPQDLAARFPERIGVVLPVCGGGDAESRSGSHPNPPAAALARAPPALDSAAPMRGGERFGQPSSFNKLSPPGSSAEEEDAIDVWQWE